MGGMGRNRSSIELMVISETQSIFHLSGRLSHIIEIAPTSEGEGYFDRWTVTSSAIDVKQITYSIL
jgi:hypothetical protein